MMNKPMPLRRLTASGFGCRRGDQLVFRDVGLGLESGEALEAAGPNSCGKTSLLRVLCRLLPPEEGELLLMNLVASAHDP